MQAQDLQASYCAVLVDEWARGGVTDAVVCPGSRSTPLALALHGDDRIRIHVHHDERAGAFTALGIGLATGRPAVVVTTSGTAAAEVHAAVVEAHQAGVPLIVATADRPPELADVGAAQTIDQIRLYGSAVRWFDAPGVPDAAAAGTWRGRAARTVLEARGLGAAGRPGPVHLDCAFREPLVGEPAHVPPGRPDGQPWITSAPVAATPDLEALRDLLGRARRGLVVAGAEPGAVDPRVTADAAARVAAALDWPLVVDARLRGGLEEGFEAAVGAADALLRDPEVAAALRPDLVLHLGGPVASRIVNEWITAADAVEVRVGAHGWIDPTHRTALHVAAPATALAAARPTAPATEPGWNARWRRVEAAAQEAIDATLAAEPADAPTEAGTARRTLADLADGAHLVVSSSMPIRDVEWYGRPRSGVTVHANRGANGIDGVLSTAIGVALGSGAPTTCLIGDVALLHDSSALIGLASRDVDLTIVVVDNDGGGIFSFLPQAASPGGAAFEALFGTPHGTDIPALAAAHGVAVTHVRTDRAANVAAHRRHNQAIAEAARAAL